MNKFRNLISCSFSRRVLKKNVLIFLFLGTSQIIPQNAYVEITFQAANDASLTEIEWRNEPVIDEGTTGRLQAVTGSPVKIEPVPSEPYFRMRSYDKYNIPGLWSKVYKTELFVVSPQKPKPVFREPETPLVSVVDSTQQEKWYLRGNVFKVEFPPQLADSVYYKLNNSAITKYTQPLVFEKPGAYTLEMKAVPGASAWDSEQVLWQKKFEFNVDLKPPHIEIFIFPPFTWQKRKLFLESGTRIEFRVDDNDAGLESVFGRILCDENQSEPEYSQWPLQYDLPRNFECENAKLEYFSQDKAGNKSRAYSLPVAIHTR
ncbi:MAG: hypothetical protein KDK41_01385 [Leptospiraceae bacterium]|nr:hypothetical protein [Leptospiraceae bacterium]MCB1199269.1 hypothetical protein [Leptospiraceae bacterium]